MSSGGYPGTFEAGKKILGLEEAGRVDGVKVFHAAQRGMTEGSLLPEGECWG